MKKAMTRYQVIRDQQEKANYWDFPTSQFCTGTTVDHLKTGDYTLSGLESKFTIERKFSTGEFAKNITEKRFDRELERMSKMDHPFLVLEFSWHTVEQFPFASTIPSKYWPNLRVNSGFIKKRLMEIMTDYDIKVIFADTSGMEIAELLFRRMSLLYGDQKE